MLCQMYMVEEIRQTLIIPFFHTNKASTYGSQRKKMRISQIIKQHFFVCFINLLILFVVFVYANVSVRN
jgi:hypothetical protein